MQAELPSTKLHFVLGSNVVALLQVSAEGELTLEQISFAMNLSVSPLIESSFASKKHLVFVSSSVIADVHDNFDGVVTLLHRVFSSHFPS